MVRCQLRGWGRCVRPVQGNVFWGQCVFGLLLGPRRWICRSYSHKKFLKWMLNSQSFWDLIHVVKVVEKRSGRSLQTLQHQQRKNILFLFLSMFRVKGWTLEQDASVSDSNPQITNMGNLAEDMKQKMRNTLNEIWDCKKTGYLQLSSASPTSLNKSRPHAKLAVCLCARSVAVMILSSLERNSRSTY